MKVEYDQEEREWLLEWHMPECCSDQCHINAYGGGKTIFVALAQILSRIIDQLSKSILWSYFDGPRGQSWDEMIAKYRLYIDIQRGDATPHSEG